MEDRLDSIIKDQLAAELKHVIKVSMGILEPLSVESEEMYARYYASTDIERHHNYHLQQIHYGDVQEYVIPTFLEYSIKLLTTHGYSNDRYSQLERNDRDRFEWEDQFDYRWHKYYDDLRSICGHAKKISGCLSDGLLGDAHRELNVLKARFGPLTNTIASKPIKLSLDELHGKVINMLQHLKRLVENNGIWKSIADEKSVQRLIYAAVSASCRIDDIDISPETDSGSGPVDIKFSQGAGAKVVAEVKLSSNGKALHGYEKQLEIYKQGDCTDRGIFVLIDVGGMGRKLDRILKVQSSFREQRGIASDVIVIDATKKMSASIRK